MFIVFFSMACSQEKDSLHFTPVIPSLVTENHEAEGFMVTLESGRIIHFFRLEEGIMSDHTGNLGKVVKRISDNCGENWSDPITVYDDEFDNRNVHGGILENGRIVLFFRRFNSYIQKHADISMIFSDDDGETWSERTPVKSEGESPYGVNLEYLPGKGYLTSFCKNYYLELKISKDGTNWDSTFYKWDYRKTKEFAFGEACFTYTGKGRIIGLIRDVEKAGISFFQVFSTDTGKTWSAPQRTNIANGYFCPSPLIFYNAKRKSVMVVATDRRGFTNDSIYHTGSEIWVYEEDPEFICQNPDKYKVYTKFKRPIFTNYRFYGYPIFTIDQEGKILIVFTDNNIRRKMRENADLYQFTIY
ncbi:MAG: hypothetical protein A2W91_03300 [Bacteroidetes bacterium GWF2_38_335]|nr:MAG: hypothetical protein A2W91_03300 [Bacteroidetes bacterium GWF2_38_335]OFY77488.1 MAG: hypothetical protein A2281_01460 [Bacteroidetes bacterium RIFOXYA12_FULL_38_20]